MRKERIEKEKSGLWIRGTESTRTMAEISHKTKMKWIFIFVKRKWSESMELKENARGFDWRIKVVVSCMNVEQKAKTGFEERIESLLAKYATPTPKPTLQAEKVL